MAQALLWAGMAAAVAGIGALRWSWSLARRSAFANCAAWLLLLFAVVLGGMAGGAWGAAIVGLVSMACAALALAWAAVRAPKRKAKAADRRVRIQRETGEHKRIGARLLTFAIVVPLCFAATIAMAIGVRFAALQIGWSEADANATALIAVPLAWGILATILLMQKRRTSQAITLVAASLPLVPALIAGS